MDPAVLILTKTGAPSCFTVTEGYVILRPGAHTKLLLFFLSTQTWGYQLFRCHLFGAGGGSYTMPHATEQSQLPLRMAPNTLEEPAHTIQQVFGRCKVAQPPGFLED